MSHTIQDLMAMPDDEFMQVVSSEEGSANGEGNTSPNADSQEVVLNQGEENAAIVPAPVSDAGVVPGADPSLSGSGVDTPAAGQVDQNGNPVPPAAVAIENQPAPAAVPAPQAGAEQQPAAGETAGTVADGGLSPDKFYEEVMKPFKANGKEFRVRNPEEAIRLMQRGAGAGKQLAELAPHIRTIKTLEKEGLLDSDRLNFLIDLSKNNPDAIKKLIKDAGIDPLDINVDEAPQYTPQDHQVSNEELRFHGVMEQVATAPEGKETLRLVNNTWDAESKAALWKEPELLTTIHEQRLTGVYDLVMAEVERMEVLGQIPTGTSKIKAYEIAGAALVQQRQATQPGAMVQPQVQAPVVQQPVVLETRAAAPKPQVSNAGMAAAAGTHTNKGKPAKPVKSISELFKMSDEEFLRDFTKNRS